MKKYKSAALVKICLLAFLFLPTFLIAQNNDDITRQQVVSYLLDNHHFRFIADWATSENGRRMELDNENDLDISKEEIKVNLPYFGTSYSSRIDPSDNGIRFTLKNFDYTTLKRKKDGWNIVIKGKDASNSPTLNLTVFSNGKATLQVTSSNRQSISYDGYILEPAEVKQIN
jgi:hypothetical protein